MTTPDPASARRLVSIVVPAFDEEESLPPLFESLSRTIALVSWNCELIVIDDGSTDGTWETLKRLHEEHPDVPLRAFRFRRNFGKATALDLGFKMSKGDCVVTMDADLQDDPSEIGALLAKLDEGWDLVSGWKRTRHDPISKTLPSRLFNVVTAWVTGIRLHDFNCGIKAYRRETVSSLRIYGELHRFIPALVHAKGFRVTEIPVNHNPRKFGVSKYGWRRFLRGFLDLLTVVATTKYLARPAHLFGSLGVLIGAIGMTALIYLSTLWFLGRGPIGERPLLLFGVLCVLMSAQFISFGLLAELLNSRNARVDPGELVAEKCDDADKFRDS